MNGRERERLGSCAEALVDEEPHADGGLPVERGTCRDLVTDDRHHAAWVGVVSGEYVVGVAAAGAGASALSDLTVRTDGEDAVSRAVDTGQFVTSGASSEPAAENTDRVPATTGGETTEPPEAVRAETEATLTTVAVPFWQPGRPEASTRARPETELSAGTEPSNEEWTGQSQGTQRDQSERTQTDQSGETRPEPPDGVLVVYTTESAFSAGECRTLSTLAGTLGRHRVTEGRGSPLDSVDARFREAFERHDAVMLLIDPDTGQIRTANEAAADFYGYDASTLDQMRIQEINTATPAEVAAERDRARREERNYFVFEHELASGECRTVEVHSTPIPLDDGPVLFSVIHDVTEQVEYERELERYGDLFENVPVGLFRSRPGPEGQFDEVNPALVEMFGASSRAELLDTSPSELYVDEDDRAAFSDDLLADGVVEEREYELRRLDGETFWGSVSAIRTETDDGPVFDGIVLDISERRAYEESLEERNERMEVLNQLLRHDIRNDMTVIGGNVDLLEHHLEDGDADSERLQELLTTLRERADHVVELTHTARNITESLSIESGEQPEATPVRLDQVLADELENARSSYPDAEFELSESVPAVEVSATELLDSVFRNLFNNAVQHNDTPEPTVTVDVAVDAETVSVTVADDGPGIPDAQKSAVFERGEKGTASSGTGLGLYLVGSLVDQYDGEIDVRDNEPRGAVFEVTLQRADSEADETTDVFGGVAR